MKHLLAAFSVLSLAAACNAAEPLESAPAPASAPAEQTSSSPAAEPESATADYAFLGQKLPAFTAPMADGTSFDSAALEHWTVIAVWGAWCGDSVDDGPYTAALDRAIAQDPDLDFVSIHVPPGPDSDEAGKPFGDHASLEAYFTSADYTLPVIVDTDGSLRALLQVNWTPSYLLVSPDGIVRHFQTDLSADKDQPVKNYIQNVAETRKAVRDLLASDPSDVE